jgi:hypothetical protein
MFSRKGWNLKFLNRVIKKSNGMTMYKEWTKEEY